MAGSWQRLESRSEMMSILVIMATTKYKNKNEIYECVANKVECVRVFFFSLISVGTSHQAATELTKQKQP